MKVDNTRNEQKIAHLKEQIENLQKGTNKDNLVTATIYQKGVNFLAGVVRNLENTQKESQSTDSVASTSKSGVALSKNGFVSII